ncbi:MAG TPA: FeoA family protein [Verrucomicrobiota bacterium]|nr:FeoA family protein [Verrucomicrobiota bacterium]
MELSFKNRCVPGDDCESQCGECPLTLARTSVALRIRRLCAAPEVQDRLRELGFCEDQIIRLITNRTNFICQVCNTRLALSEQLAKLIVVEPVLQPLPIRP